MSSAGAPVMIMAGGTGGHIFPALAVAKVLRARGVPVVWLGADGAMETLQSNATPPSSSISVASPTPSRKRH